MLESGYYDSMRRKLQGNVSGGRKQDADQCHCFNRILNTSDAMLAGIESTTLSVSPDNTTCSSGTQSNSHLPQPHIST
jgi:hypothetical protein